MPQDSVFSAIVRPVHLGAFSHTGNKLIGYVDDFTLLPVVPSQGYRVIVAEFLSRDLGKVGE